MAKTTPLLTAASLVILAGCGASRPPTYEVTGKVTYNGKPIPEGNIVFAPTDKVRGPTSGFIKNGMFRIACLEGSMRVEILASREVPGKDPMFGGPVFANYIPEMYNTKSTLVAEVSPQEKNSFDFVLEGD